MTKFSKNKFSEKYLLVQDTYEQINNIFSKFESGEIPNDQKEQVIEDVLTEIKTILSVLKRLNIKDIYGEYDDTFIKSISDHIKFFKTGLDYFYEEFIRIKLYDEVIDSVRNYILNMKMLPSEYKKYAENEKQLTAKFTTMLVKHAYIFKNQIKRMAIGTLSQKEFEKIYKTNHHKMIPTAGFQSYSNYKE